MKPRNEFEKAFAEVRDILTIKDRRTKAYKHEISFAKQEFFAEVKESGEDWFKEKVRSLRSK